MPSSYATVFSPVGRWTVEGDDLGLTRIFMPHEQAPVAAAAPSQSVTRAAIQLEEYFAGNRTTFDVTLADTPATHFQRRVWQVLQSLPYGTVATYGRVAELTGHPRAARAVGNANHANPWPVIIPCHRVVASDGLGGYGGESDVKRYLLALEGIAIAG